MGISDSKLFVTYFPGGIRLRALITFVMSYMAFFPSFGVEECASFPIVLIVKANLPVHPVLSVSLSPTTVGSTFIP